MANEARLLDFSDVPPLIALGDGPVDDDVDSGSSQNKTPLLDLSVDAETDAQLTASGCHAKIRIQLPQPSAVRHPSFLPYLGSHTRGRGALYMIDEDQILKVGFSVLSGGADQVLLVERFAADIARYLDLPKASVLVAEVVEMTTQRESRILSAVGIRPPELRLV